MANRILKGLAVAAGTGLAMGLNTGRTGRVHLNGAGRLQPPSETDLTAGDAAADFLDIGPLLDRLEQMEARVERLINAPVTVNFHARSLAELERRMNESTRELAQLRLRIEAVERRAEAEAEESGRRIPAIVAEQVAARTAGLENSLENHFTREIEHSRQQTLAMFERSIDEKISSRIGSIEQVLAGQAESIELLTTRSAQTDQNLQRLVAAIEKLCERAQFAAPAQVPEPEVYRMPTPFETQLQTAMAGEPTVPKLRVDAVAAEVAAPAFTSGSGKKSRFLFRNLVVAGLALLASRLLR